MSSEKHYAINRHYSADDCDRDEAQARDDCYLPSRKFTPGPWKVTNTNGLGNVRIQPANSPHTVAVVVGFETMGLPSPHNVNPTEAKANARLIAAAPALFEACQDAKKYLEPDLVEPGRTVFWRLVAAIKNASLP